MASRLRLRQCPSLRTCWPSRTLASLNPFVRPRRLALRRTAFLLINILQAGYLILFISHRTLSSSEQGWILAATLFFFCRMRILHQLVREEFDAFLWVVLMVYLGLFGGWISKGALGAAEGCWAVDFVVMGIAWAGRGERKRAEMDNA